MACAGAARTIALRLASRGRLATASAAGEATAGVYGTAPGSALSFVVIGPASGGVDLSRSQRFVFALQDATAALCMETLVVRYRQQPYPLDHADGWVVAYSDEEFPNGFQGTGSEVAVVPSGPGQLAVVSIDPQFGLLPAGTHTVEVSYTDSGGELSTWSWTFTTEDSASSADVRLGLSRLWRTADRYGWGRLLTMAAGYTYETDELYTGSRLTVSLNESLAADLSDQMSDDSLPENLGILRTVRRFRLLVKPGEHPRDAYDPDATLLADDNLAGESLPVMVDRGVPVDEVVTDFEIADRQAGQMLYASVFLLRPIQGQGGMVLDWTWAFTPSLSFASAYPYGRYGHGPKLFSMMPLAMQMADTGAA